MNIYNIFKHVNQTFKKIPKHLNVQGFFISKTIQKLLLFRVRNNLPHAF